MTLCATYSARLGKGVRGPELSCEEGTGTGLCADEPAVILGTCSVAHSETLSFQTILNGIDAPARQNRGRT